MAREYTYEIKFESNLEPAFADLLAKLDNLPRVTSTVAFPLPRRRLPNNHNASDVPVGEWGTMGFNIDIEGAPLESYSQTCRLARYQPQDGDGPAWVEYEVWNRIPTGLELHPE